MDWLIYFIGLAFVAWGFYRIGYIIGHANGSWGPMALKRLTAAREDAFANGVRYAKGDQDKPRQIIPDIADTFPEEA